MVNLLLLILLIVTKSCVLYILMHTLSSRLLWVQQCEFEEYLDDDIAPNYQGPWNKIESTDEYNVWDQEHRWLMHQYLNTIQQLAELEIGAKMSEDQLMICHMVRGVRARTGGGE
jgi:hypothetical protein